MRTFQNTVIVHVNGESRLSPFRIEFLAAFGTNVFLRGNMLPCQPPGNHNKRYRGDRNDPPRHFISTVNPVHRTRRQGKHREAKHQNKYSNAFFHRVLLYAQCCQFEQKYNKSEIRIANFFLNIPLSAEYITALFSSALTPTPRRSPSQTAHIRG